MMVIDQGTQEYLNSALTLPSLCVPQGMYVHKRVVKESKVAFY